MLFFEYCILIFSPRWETYFMMGNVNFWLFKCYSCSWPVTGGSAMGYKDRSPSPWVACISLEVSCREQNAGLMKRPKFPPWAGAWAALGCGVLVATGPELLLSLHSGYPHLRTAQTGTFCADWGSGTPFVHQHRAGSFCRIIQGAC